MSAELKAEDVQRVVAAAPEPVRELLTWPLCQDPPVLAGGFVRDTLVGARPLDLDVFWSANIAIPNEWVQRHGIRVTRLAWLITDWAYDGWDIPIQTIRVQTTPLEHLATFDFTVCQAGIWHDRGTWYSTCHEKFYEDLAAKRLRLTSPAAANPRNGLRRALKLAARGYTADNELLAALAAAAVMGTPLAIERLLDEKVLREQLERMMSPPTSPSPSLGAGLDPGAEPVDEYGAWIERQAQAMDEARARAGQIRTAFSNSTFIIGGSDANPTPRPELAEQESSGGEDSRIPPPTVSGGRLTAEELRRGHQILHQLERARYGPPTIEQPAVPEPPSPPERNRAADDAEERRTGRALLHSLASGGQRMGSGGSDGFWTQTVSHPRIRYRWTPAPPVGQIRVVEQSDPAGGPGVADSRVPRA